MKRIYNFMIEFFFFLKRYIRFIIFELQSIPTVFLCLFYSLKRKKYIIVSAWCRYKLFYFFRKDKIIHNNWGDDINVYFLEMISKKKVLVYPTTRIATYISKIINVKKNAFIGSILTDYSLNNATVIGSGVLNDKQCNIIKGSPDDVLFVRGPLSRQILLKNGIDCPQLYGDPALLIPYFYVPKIKENYKIGLIPHYQDYDSKIVIDILKQNKDDVIFIKMRDYSLWTDVIDEIVSCDFIISSSLHGLIVSEAYKIPSVWVHFNKYIEGWDFKFYDFYHSIDKIEIKPVVIDSSTQIWDLYNQKASGLVISPIAKPLARLII